ncbi:paraquat-inducible protein A [Neorhizobium lilium]|uniref:Paraquat-inducible protein A n=1 Tax=Neorhizobium lilium TaxID=2503024 RepID=A0A444LIQ2_9HYPH|nr:paraquat-inducible protein A [Neorhizobium lilium]RWX78913.1 paraquat-inducible protein A [Neorhizobium lilium]
MTRLAVPLLFAAACLFLILGIYLPIIRFDKLYVFSETPSLLELVSTLWDEGDVMLALLVATFSIGFPIFKLVALGVEIAAKDRHLPLLRRAMPHLSKWSMMDVMLVAIVIFAAKSSGLAKAVTQPGLWFYAGSALIAALLPSLVVKMRQ